MAQVITETAPHVLQAISEITAIIAKKGIAKQDKGKATAGRGIDDVMNMLAPLLDEHKLNISPISSTRTVTPFVSGAGDNAKTRFYVYLDVAYEFSSVLDGSSKIVRVPGEAMDYGDKATIKAMSIAYKIACIQTFCIPTERDPEIAEREHEEAVRQQNMETEKQILELIDGVNNADTYREARERILPLLLLIKATDAALAATYEAKMIDLRDKHVPRKTPSVDDLREGRK